MKKKDLLIEDPFIDNDNDINYFPNVLKKASSIISAFLTGNAQRIKNNLSFLPSLSIDKIKFKMEHNFPWFAETYNFFYKHIENALNMPASKYFIACVTIAAICYAAAKLVYEKANKQVFVDIKNITSENLKKFIGEIKERISKLNKIVKEKLYQLKELEADQVVGITVLVIIVSFMFRIMQLGMSASKLTKKYADTAVNLTVIIGKLFVMCLIVLKFVAGLVLVIIPASLTVISRAFWGLIKVF